MKASKKRNLALACASLMLMGAAGCGGGSGAAGTASSLSLTNLPKLTPVVKAAVPSGLGGTGSGSKIFNHYLHSEDQTVTGTQLNDDIGNLQSRFFSSQGPTEILGQLMPSLDSLISNINSITANSTDACLSQSPVAYTITPAGKSVTMYAQCYNTGTASFSGDPALFQFGMNSGILYIYAAWGAEWTAAIVTPVPGSTGDYTVEAYLGVGYSNATSSGQGDIWDGGSYGLIELSANSATSSFEIAVAGGGLGFCGAQMVSDGTNIYASISNDMGEACGTGASGTTNGVTDDLCVSASNLTASTCSAAEQTFSLYPIGRTGGVAQSPQAANNNQSNLTYGASTYPSTPNVTFNGTSSDSLHFGPTSPTSGVGQLTSGGGNNTPTAAQLASAITSACPSVPSGVATTAANAGLAASQNGEQAAITALNTSLSNQGYSSQTSCADTAVENVN